MSPDVAQELIASEGGWSQVVPGWREGWRVEQHFVFTLLGKWTLYRFGV